MPTAKPMVAPLSDAAMKAGIDFAMDALKRMPTATREEIEAHITGVLIVFWGALWGTMGTEYAEGFIQQQLRNMDASKATGYEVWTPPQTH